MATKLLHSQIPTSHVLPCSIPTLRTQRTAASTNHPIHRAYRSNFAIKAAEQSSSLVGDQTIDYSTINRIKTNMNETLQGLWIRITGINRGIFGITSEKKSEIEDMVKVLESLNPNPHPTLDLDKLGGCWKLIYSTITILGSKRTKLGLRDFISLGDFLQVIDVAKRVDISYNTSNIIPDQLKNMFNKNYDVLLGIFNPDGWLETTYVDETLRIGRDDKGNIFILERSILES